MLVYAAAVPPIMPSVAGAADEEDTVGIFGTETEGSFHQFCIDL
jgi:hypothetical protein